LRGRHSIGVLSDGTTDAWDEQALEAERLSQMRQVEQKPGAVAEIVTLSRSTIGRPASILALLALIINNFGCEEEKSGRKMNKNGIFQIFPVFPASMEIYS
jgi:hypothetical protein